MDKFLTLSFKKITLSTETLVEGELFLIEKNHVNMKAYSLGDPALHIKWTKDAAIQDVLWQLNNTLRDIPFMIVPFMPDIPIKHSSVKADVDFDSILTDEKELPILVYFVHNIKVAAAPDSRSGGLVTATLSIGLLITGASMEFNFLTDAFEFGIPIDLLPIDTLIESMTPIGVISLMCNIFNLGFNNIPSMPVDLTGIPPQEKQEAEKRINIDREKLMSPRRSINDSPWLRRFIGKGGL